MSVSPEHLLKLADSMLELLREIDRTTNSQQFEVTLRAVVSTSYYAVYHSSLEYAKLRGYRYDSAESGGVHAQLWRWLRANNQLALGTEGKEFHDHRIWADYRLDRVSHLNCWHLYHRAVLLVTKALELIQEHEQQQSGLPLDESR